MVPLPASPTAAPRVAADCGQLVVNGDFSEGTKHWSFIGPTTGIRIFPGVDGDGLATRDRDEWFHGMSQTVNKDCLNVGVEYEVSMDVKILDSNDEPTGCDVFNQYYDFGLACPTLAMRLDNTITRDIAKPVGPWDPSGWNKVYGIYEVTADLLSTTTLEMYVTKAIEGKNLAVDNVSVKPVSSGTFGLSTCSQLIINGDAEIGDARFWHIKGNGNFGDIEMISPGATGNYAFYHTGSRSHAYNGLRQELDQECMPVGSSWTISFKIKLFDTNNNGVDCDKEAYGGPSVCPMVFVQSFSRDAGSLHYTLPLRNASPGPWIPNDWNDYTATFVMTNHHKTKDTTEWFIHNVLPGYTYQVDDISMVPT
jgi:hypothetical protein